MPAGSGSTVMPMAQVKTETFYGMTPAEALHNYAEWRRSKPDIEIVKKHGIEQKVVQDDQSPRALTKPNAYSMLVEFKEE
jgi:hypothetical protein